MFNLLNCLYVYIPVERKVPEPEPVMGPEIIDNR